MGKLILAYWALRGIGEPIRIMLEYAGVEYENKKYYEEKEWIEDKFKLGLDFPNLPYMLDGDIKISESQAIIRYIARKHGLMPTDPKALAECEMAEGVVADIRYAIIRDCYSSDFDKAKLKEPTQQRLVMMDQFLSGRPFLAGDNLSYVDFQLYETLDHHRLLYPDTLDKFPNIKAFMERFSSLERIAAYFKSDRYSLFPILGPTAKWGGKKEAD